MKKPQIISEFNIGDTVTYHPHEVAHECEVKDVRLGMRGDGKTIHGDPDDRIFYKIEGDSINSICTGKCIKESKLYEPETTIH